MATNLVDRKRINMGGFRDFSDIHISIPIYRSPNSVFSADFNQQLISRFKESTRLIFVDLETIPFAQDFFETIQEKFDGTFIIDSRDQSLETKPKWVGSMARWAAPNIPNPKTSTGILIPLGVEEARRATHNLPWLFPKHRPMINRIIIGPFAQTHRSRASLDSKDSTKSIEVMSQRLSPRQYVKHTKDFRMVFCPRGNGIDTHRVWETLYRNSIPILIRSEWSEYFKNLGLPFFLIDKIEELYELTNSHIENIYSELYSKLEANKSQLTHEYWISRIKTLGTVAPD